jgi:hemoglobin
MGMPELEIYSMIGAEGFARLVAAFYRQVSQDDLLGPIYPASDIPGDEQRLRDFLIGRFGGPQTYIEQRGHPRLRARHSPFAINQTIRDRWMRRMENALGEASLPSKAEEVLRTFFNEMSTFMINQSESRINWREATRRGGARPYPRYVRLILHEENWLPLIRSLGTFTTVTNKVGGRRAPAVH